MKIDIYTHVLPPRYREALYRHSDKFLTERRMQDFRYTLTDNEARLRKLDGYDDMVQVLSATLPPLEEIVSPAEAAELARIANDETAEILNRNPERYVAAIANLPLNDIDAAMKEAERAIKELGFKGVQIYTSIRGKPLSSEEFMPLYHLMWQLDLPIWIHPLRRSNTPDYPTETDSYHQIFSVFGWPFDTTAAMARLVFAGVFERFPGIKFITHHLGGMVPYYADRITVHYNVGLQRLGTDVFPGLTRPPIDYFRMFYADTALDGNPDGVCCGLGFFGEDHLLFGTDFPYDVENGNACLRQTVAAVDALEVSDRVRKKIYEDNGKRLLRL